MDTNKMREQFEAWAAKNYVVPPGVGHLFVRAEIGDGYRLSSINHAWHGWQASREAVVVELPKVVGFEGAYDSHRHHEFVPSMSDVEDADEIFGLCRRVETKEAIEAQGLKVEVKP
ncbi:hypothetical protein ACIP1G_11015 [Pseudomonas sp. NPDC089392]|uniref:hypothetical protein n=1 Tax=Pseudomonas sp. NPDC089392 TaxID=3364459 RepID=UPI0037F31D57